MTRTPVMFIWEAHPQEQGSKMDLNFPKVQGWNSPMDYQDCSKRTVCDKHRLHTCRLAGK